MMTNTICVRLKVVSSEGRIYISSDDVPGLYLWGTDPEEVFESVVPAIKELFKHNKGMDVEVVAQEPTRAERWSGLDPIPQAFMIREIQAQAIT
jgi:hypothetical protein